MRWLAFFIFAYLLVGLDHGLSAFLQIWGGRVNLVLLGAVFIATNAAREPALLGCFVLGAMQDLFTAQPLGLYALCYGLAGMLIVGTQAVVDRNNPLTHAALALLAITMTETIVLIQDWTRGPGQLRLKVVVMTILLTTVAAPVVILLFQRLRRLFGFQPTRRRGGGRVLRVEE